MKAVTEKQAKAAASRGPLAALRCSEKKWEAIVAFGEAEEYFKMFAAEKGWTNCACCYKWDNFAECTDCPLTNNGPTECCGTYYDAFTDAKEFESEEEGLTAACKVLAFIRRRRKEWEKKHSRTHEDAPESTQTPK